MSRARKSKQEPFPVFLRELALGDFENWRQAYSMLGAPRNPWDEGPWRASELTSVKFRELLRAEEKLRKADRQYSFGVFRKEDGLLVGHVYLMDISRGVFQNAYVGYRIFNPYWAQGYGTAALKLAARVAFKDLKLHRIEAGIAPENEASVKIALKAELRCEGLSRKRLLIDRKWVDLLIFAATSEDFGVRFRP